MDERRELLGILAGNARQSTDDIARQLGCSEQRVETLIADLEADGVIRGYRAVVDWDAADEEHVEAHIELNVELDRETTYDEIAARIAKFPEVDTLRLVSGSYDFSVVVVGDSMRSVSAFVSDNLAPIPAVTQTVTHFAMATYKRGGVGFDSDDDDDRLSVSP
jgi:DNA-binding Lrp family transcriptional regulator